MRRQILIGIVAIGYTSKLLNDLTEDQREGLLNEGYAELLVTANSLQLIKLTEKGRKTYHALDAVIAMGTQW